MAMPIAATPVLKGDDAQRFFIRKWPRMRKGRFLTQKYCAE